MNVWKPPSLSLPGRGRLGRWCLTRRPEAHRPHLSTQGQIRGFIGEHAPTRPGKSLRAWSREVWHLQSNTVLCSRQIERGGGLMLILRLSRSWNHSVWERIISIVLMCSKYVFLKSDITFSFARENMHDRWTAILTALFIIAARRFLKNTVVCVFMQLSINCSVASWILNERKKKEEGALLRAFK